MKAFVTGVTGFVGGELARVLLERGYQVAGLVRPESRAKVPAGVEPVIGELADQAALERGTQGRDVVFHSAALLGEPPKASGEAWYEAVNVAGTVDLARAASRAGVRRFVQVSTVGVYGNAHRALTEADEEQPDSVYHRTKCAADRELIGFAKSAGLPYVIVRPPITVGPGNLKTHLLKMAKLAARDRFPTFGSDLKQRLPLVEVADLADALELAARVSPPDETYLISSGEGYSFGEILGAMARFSGGTSGTLRVPRFLGLAGALTFEALAAVTGIAPPLTRHKLAVFEQDRAMDISKAKRLLGYAPRYTKLEHLLERALTDYRARGLIPAKR